MSCPPSDKELVADLNRRLDALEYIALLSADEVSDFLNEASTLKAELGQEPKKYIRLKSFNITTEANINQAFDDWYMLSTEEPKTRITLVIKDQDDNGWTMKADLRNRKWASTPTTDKKDEVI